MYDFFSRRREMLLPRPQSFVGLQSVGSNPSSSKTFVADGAASKPLQGHLVKVKCAIIISCCRGSCRLSIPKHSLVGMSWISLLYMPNILRAVMSSQLEHNTQEEFEIDFLLGAGRFEVGLDCLASIFRRVQPTQTAQIRALDRDTFFVRFLNT